MVRSMKTVNKRKKEGRRSIESQIMIVSSRLASSCLVLDNEAIIIHTCHGLYHRESCYTSVSRLHRWSFKSRSNGSICFSLHASCSYITCKKTKGGIRLRNHSQSDYITYIPVPPDSFLYKATLYPMFLTRYPYSKKSPHTSYNQKSTSRLCG